MVRQFSISTPFLFFVLLFLSCSEPRQNKHNGIWSYKKALEHFQNQNDSSKWDTSFISTDLKEINPQSGDFMKYGVFPTPSYDLIGKGSFKGLGNHQGILKIQDKDISFIFYKKKHTK